MAVRIRLALFGPRHNRIYHLVASEGRAARNSEPIETLGVFNPNLKPGETTRTVEWSRDRIIYWLKNGAEPTPSATRLITMGGLGKSVPLRFQMKTASAPKPDRGTASSS